MKHQDARQKSRLPEKIWLCVIYLLGFAIVSLQLRSLIG